LVKRDEHLCVSVVSGNETTGGTDFITMTISRYQKIIYFALIISFLSIPANSQNTWLNEIMSLNTNTLTDEDGNYPDWIEVYHSDSLSIAGGTGPLRVPIPP